MSVVVLLSQVVASGAGVGGLPNCQRAYGPRCTGLRDAGEAWVAAGVAAAFPEVDLRPMADRYGEFDGVAGCGDDVASPGNRVTGAA